MTARTFLVTAGVVLLATVGGRGVSAQTTCGNIIDPASGCDYGWHTAPVAANGTVDGPHSLCQYCVFSPCHHGCNPADEENLTLLDAAISSGDPAAVSSALAPFRGRVILNRVRSALQIAGCGGSGIREHFPVDQRLLEAVLTEQEQQEETVVLVQ
jgi:hypothetical protein